MEARERVKNGWLGPNICYAFVCWSRLRDWWRTFLAVLISTKSKKKKADCLRVSYARENRETRISWAHVTPFHPTNQPTRKPIRKIDCFRHKLAEWGRTIHAGCDGWLVGLSKIDFEHILALIYSASRLIWCLGDDDGLIILRRRIHHLLVDNANTTLEEICPHFYQFFYKVLNSDIFCYVCNSFFS